MTVVNHNFWEPISVFGDDSPFNIFAIDPGGTTGWAKCLVVDGDYQTVAWGQVASLGPGVASVQHGEQAAVKELHRLIVLHGSPTVRTHVVVEDFVVRQGTMDRNLLSPVRLTAALFDRLHSSQWEFYFHLQSPSDAKSTITDDVLKKNDAWAVGQQHARDALRHMFTALRRINRGT